MDIAITSRKYGVPDKQGWLGSLDSNQERMIQSHLCYHYTTSQHVEILRGYYTIKYGHCLKVA